MSVSLTAEQLSELLEEALDFSHVNGIVLRRANGDVKPIPFSLLPTPMPQSAFELARSLTTAFHFVRHRVVQARSFLPEILADAAQQDEFLRRLLTLEADARRIGIRQTLALSVCRADYMLHRDPSSGQLSLQQVEVNMISAGFSNLSPKIAAMHRYLVDRHAAYLPRAGTLPENNASHVVCQGMLEAYQAYGVPGAIVLMVVQPNEKNAFDQRPFEYFFASQGVTLRRHTLKQIGDLAQVDERTGALRLRGEEVALAYFRAGYTPRDYPSDDEWRARLVLETSRAIKCPTVAFQLSGLKKVQQVLADTTTLRRFVSDEALLARMQRVTASLWALGDGKDHAIVAAAIADRCKHYVLKPQREGGGNNLYEENATAALERMSEEERRAFILMSRIQVPARPCYMVRDGAHADVIEASSELGFYGVLLADGDNVLFNRFAGSLLRSKNAAENDGGVAAGVAVMDSVVLTDD
jgi:glutathione synthetase